MVLVCDPVLMNRRTKSLANMKTKKEVQKSPQEVSEMNKSVSVDEYAEGDTSDEEVI